MQRHQGEIESRRALARRKYTYAPEGKDSKRNCGSRREMTRDATTWPLRQRLVCAGAPPRFHPTHGEDVAEGRVPAQSAAGYPSC
eukprot:scaffold1142_cov387-Prasinococcus_capsulatus_cf.AAC.12